ncbi:MAG: hypothetical protein JKY29_12970 [Gammaproteobacteria bacterium]|nr:hypothetical protein [Gammaproteobacteria bacterium]
MTNQTQQSPLRVEVQHVGFFETPIAYCRLQEGETLIQELEKSIQKKRAQTEGLNRSNIRGWHSDTDMLQWGGEPAIRLAESAINICKRMSHFQEASPDSYDWQLRMWANVTPPGGLNQPHAHPGNLWAAVLYLDMGDESDSSGDVGGAFYIEDPRFPMAAMHNTAVRMIGADGNPQQYEVEFKLERGNIVVFPAWLRHGVRPYTGNRERISIAMNIDARRKD